MKNGFADMRGAYAALFTPFDEKDRVNPDAIARIVEYGLANGLRGFYLTGTTGEWWLMSVEERMAVYDAAAAANRGRGKLIAHVGANRTEDAVALARHAADVGADWISAVVPPLYSTSFEATCRHYAAIASATDLPFLAYSFTSALVPARDARIFDIPNVMGMKYTGRDYYAAQTLKRALDKETLWFAGCDEQLLCALSLGDVFAGGIGINYNIIPRHFADICRLAAAGDFAGAAARQAEANRLVELLLEPENWTYRKAFMRFVGIDCGPYRMPFGPITEEEYAAWARRIAALGFIRENQALEIG
ncbi:MAG: dihydrodipicolinate synthase family protein [Kiritimatiellae bacterium]|nr:dihydrodipicolinate synthase family protein [Kiritimatiellia bacterium]